jgi:hypothetical protein
VKYTPSQVQIIFSSKKPEKKDGKEQDLPAPWEKRAKMEDEEEDQIWRKEEANQPSSSSLRVSLQVSPSGSSPHPPCQHDHLQKCPLAEHFYLKNHRTCQACRKSEGKIQQLNKK